MNYNTVREDASIEKAVAALKEHGITAEVVENGEAARMRVLTLIPEESEVMTMTSVTLEATGIAHEINESGRYHSVRHKLNQLDRATQGDEMQKLGAAPEWAGGSVHAVTEDGAVMIASNTGSQLPAYAYGARHVIWVVGAQKIVKDKEDGMKRIYEYTLPLESERAKKAYGVSGSAVNKMLVVNNEVQPCRITMIIVKEVLGF